MKKISMVVWGGLSGSRCALRALVALGVLGSACGEVKLNAGSTGDAGARPGADGGANPGDDVGVPWPGTPSNSFDQPCTGAAPDSVRGIWQGELDSFVLPSGSKAIRIDVAGGGANGGLCGTVTFGTGEPPPLATDPAAAPPAAPASLILAPDADRAVVEGFAYEFNALGAPPFDPGGIDGALSVPGEVLMLPRAVEGSRIRFGITLRQVYKSWCNLQLAFPRQTNFLTQNAPQDDFLCAPPDLLANEPGGTYCADDGPLTNITVHHASCEQAVFCLAALCSCGNGRGPGVEPLAGCTVFNNASTRFDLAVSGSTLSGSVVLTGQSVETMHLTRVP
jgi:hypothetical protein